MARLVRIQLAVQRIEVDLATLERFASIAEEIARGTGREDFDIPVEVDLDVSEGSLKVLSVVLGALFSTYYFVGNYKAFKEGVVEMCHDANKYGDDFCDKFLKQVGITKIQPAKRKVEVQTPARLRTLLNDLEALDDAQTLEELNSPTFAHHSRFVRLARARTVLEHILHTLDEPDRVAVTGSLVFNSLPPPAQWPHEDQLSEPLRVEKRPRELRSPSEGRGRELGVGRARRPKLRVKRKVFIEPRAKRK